MKKNNYIKYGLLLVFLFITFFTVNVHAASFKYSEFNDKKWEEILKKNRNFWTSLCHEDKDNDDNDEKSNKSNSENNKNNNDTEKDDNNEENECVDKVLLTKKKYYKRLYELLADVEKKVGFINDNYIIVTTFYGLNADSFKDPDENEEYNPYNIDENEETKNKYVGKINSEEKESAKEYFNKETDTLKELVNSFVGYDSKCYGISDKPVKKDENGNSYCDDNLDVIKTGILGTEKCALKVNNYKGTFWDVIGFPFIKTETEKKCEEEAKEKGYNETDLQTESTEKVDEEYFWEYLKTSNYFDRKKHLSSFFRSILNDSGYDSMEELEENEEEYEKYKDRIVKAREIIIKYIKKIIEEYGDKFNNVANADKSSCSTSYWWPIGSSETTESDSVTMATGDPESTTVTSGYGPRTHPITGEVGKKHNGIDIGGTKSSTNVIAAMGGTVFSVTTGCNEGDKSCGGGYGNHVVIEHNDGNYTIYAHMYENSITVNQGDSVNQGQVIGKVGNTGSSSGAHLHFEVRVGGSDSNSSQDPLNFVKAEEPRSGGGTCDSMSGEFLKMLHYFEGDCNAPKNGNNYVVHNDGYGIPTVGYGVALVHNVERFKKYNINVSGMSIGAEIPIDIVDKVELEERTKFLGDVEAALSKESVTLEQYQIDCLVMVAYQFGNIGNLPQMYKQYGNADILRDTVYNISGGRPSWYYFKSNPSTGNGRAEATWKLFHEGKYTYTDNC